MVKKSTELNLPDCYNVMVQSYRESAIKAGFPERGRANYSYTELVKSYQNGDMIYYSSHNEKTVGILRLKKISDDSCKIEDIAVLPEYQGKGFGKELLDFAKKKAIELEAVKVELGMFDDNTILKDWYLKNGFVSVNTKIYDGSPFVIRILEFSLL